MANIEHKSITDANRHEPKGASTATLNQVLKSAGDGTTFFGFVNFNELAGAPTKLGYKKIIYAVSTASAQNPSGTNSTLQVEFGAAQSVTDVSLSSVGTLTFTTAGQYLIDLSYRCSKSASTGTAILVVRATQNGVQVGPSSSAVLTDLAQVVPCNDFILIDAAAGDTFKLELIRDSAGMNDGGLKQTTTSMAGWNGAPSASMTVYKYVG